jgi:hypothetical protein
MGAGYMPIWSRVATHLICAFSNTPKFKEADDAGGIIVRKEWIYDCFKKQKLLAIGPYLLQAKGIDQTNLPASPSPKKSPTKRPAPADFDSDGSEEFPKLRKILPSNSVAPAKKPPVSLASWPETKPAVTLAAAPAPKVPSPVASPVKDDGEKTEEDEALIAAEKAKRLPVKKVRATKQIRQPSFALSTIRPGLVWPLGGQEAQRIDGGRCRAAGRRALLLAPAGLRFQSLC